MRRILLIAALAAPFPAAAKSKLLTPADMLDRLEKLDVAVEIKPLDALDHGDVDLRPLLWPSVRQRLSDARVRKDSSGALVVEEAPCKAEALAIIDEAEPLFGQKKFEETAKIYRKATGVDPSCETAWSFLGESLAFIGKPAEALEAYDKSLALNPLNYRTHFFRATALLRAKRADDALSAMVTSLALNPRNEILLDAVPRAFQNKIRPAPDAVMPRSIARREGDRIVVYSEPSAPWLAFSLCKALWLADPAYRKDRTGREKHVFTSTEESECLVALAITYESEKQQKRATADPRLERLVQIAQDGMLEDLVVYELVSRVDRYVTLTLLPEQRAQLEKYIRKHVLVPVDPPKKPR